MGVGGVEVGGACFVEGGLCEGELLSECDELLCVRVGVIVCIVDTHLHTPTHTHLALCLKQC